MLGTMYRDKDGVSSAAVFAEMAAELYAKGSSVRVGGDQLPLEIQSIDT